MASTLTVDNIVGATSSSSIKIPGHVVQIAEPSLPWASRWSSTSSSFVQTPHEVSITPKYSDSKIKISTTFSGGFAADGEYMRLKLYRRVGGTLTGIGEAQATGGNTSFGFGGDWFTGAFDYIDTPNTTSPITYELWACGYYGGTLMYLGWSTSFTGENGVYMSAMEIAQ